jgi:putative copper resistance protein D
MSWFANSSGDWLIVVRAIHFAATAVMAGTLIFRMVVAEPALRLAQRAAHRFDWRARRIALVSLAISVASGVGWLLLQASAMSGLSFSEAMTGDIVGAVVTETQFGLVSEIRLVLAIIVAVGLASDSLSSARWLALASAIGLVASIAWTGHAGSTVGELGIFHLSADALHLAAAASWIGGLVSLAVLLAMTPREPGDGWHLLVHDAAQRFSTLGIVSVSALLITGIVNAGILVGSLHALLVTTYGRLLMLKVALFTVMLVFAAINRIWLTPRLAGRPGSAPEAEAVRKLTHNCFIEIALALAIFAIVGALGTMHPANHLAL